MTPRKIFKTIKNWALFLIVLTLIYGGWRTVFAYFHPYPYCDISIRKDILRGDSKSIREALRTLRREEQTAYATVCEYVDRIEEKRCYNADGHVNQTAYEKEHEGCYIRGSQTIYLKPYEYSNDVVAARSKSIAALAEKSKKFWTE
jgi:hypothetical protein